MKVGRPFKPTGKRLGNLNNLIQTKYPQDKWVLEPILPIFLSIIDSSSTIEQQEQVINLLNKVFNDYEFRYNTILENTIIMSNEFKRMQKLAGLPITETKTEENKETINENFVGMGMVGNIFDREKTDYELAFEHFTKGTSLKEEESTDSNIEDYLTGLFDQIDLGDEYEEGPQTFTFEKSEYADEDRLGGEEADMFIPAHDYISSKGTITLMDPISETPITFSTEGEDIVVSFNPGDFSEEITEAEGDVSSEYLKEFKVAISKILSDPKFKDVEEALGLNIDANGRNMGEVFQKVWDKAIKL